MIMASSGFLNSIRKWLDGEDAVRIEPEQSSPQSEWDDFFVRIAREVETVMKREMFTPPGGLTYLPGEYIIYLSREDDQRWQGRKREALEDGLRHTLAKRARELVGDKALKTERIVVSLGVDGVLEKGQVRVQEVWDDDSPRTEVTPRVRRGDTSGSGRAAFPGGVGGDAAPGHSGGDQSGGDQPGGDQPGGDQSGGGSIDLDVEADTDERTLILPRTPRFTIVYQLGAGEKMQYTAMKSRVEIGRGSKDFAIDLRLEGDQEISRRQAVVEKAVTGRFRLECVGRNAIEVDGQELQPGEHQEVDPGQTIRIGLFLLQIDQQV